MATLYRKYRPTNFEEIVNQNHIKITLKNQIQANNIGHAYLFCGPRAVGKTTIARVLSKSINCINRASDSSEPCNSCSICKDISSNSSLDIIEIDAASHTGVDNVRENIINMAQINPSKNKFKVFIIDEVHMLSISAFNALLKIMEEPPSYIVFILCTTETHKVPQTIISRCQRFDFKKISVLDITNKLEHITKKENITVKTSILESIARQSGGHMRDAESLLSQVIAVGGKEITEEEADLVIPRGNINEVITLLSYLSTKNTIESIQLINENVNNGIDLKIFINEIIESLRKIALAKTSPLLAEKLGLELGETLEKQVNIITKALDLNFLLNSIEEFKIAYLDLNNYSIPQMSIELAIIKLTNSPNNTLASTSATSNATKQYHAQPQSNQPITTIQAQNTINRLNYQASKPAEQKSAKETTNNQTQKSALKQPAKNTKPNISNSNSINLASFQARWNEVLMSLQNSNPSVSFVLRACTPTALLQNQLELSFKYKFHKDQADKPENIAIITKTLETIFNTKFTIVNIINSNPTLTTIQTPPSSEKHPAQPSSETLAQNETPPTNTTAQNNNKNNNSEMINDILTTFGGKIVG